MRHWVKTPAKPGPKDTLGAHPHLSGRMAPDGPRGPLRLRDWSEPHRLIKIYATDWFNCTHLRDFLDAQVCSL